MRKRRFNPYGDLMIRDGERPTPLLGIDSVVARPSDARPAPRPSAAERPATPKPSSTLPVSA